MGAHFRERVVILSEGYRMQRADQMTSIITFLISVVLIWGASKMTYRLEYSPAAGFFPLWLGIALAILSIALFLRTLLGSKEGKEEPFLPKKEGRIRILVYLASLTLCTLLIGKLGFVVTCFLFTAFTLSYHGKYGLKKAVVTASLMVVSLYALFNLALEVPLPKGFLGF